jgi:hypothetical protein
MSCIEVYNITDFQSYYQDEMIFIYNRLVINNYIIGGILFISTLTNMGLICGIKKHINNISSQIQNNLLPPIYK